MIMSPVRRNDSVLVEATWKGQGYSSLADDRVSITDFKNKIYSQDTLNLNHLFLYIFKLKLFFY